PPMALRRSPISAESLSRPSRLVLPDSISTSALSVSISLGCSPAASDQTGATGWAKAAAAKASAARGMAIFFMSIHLGAGSLDDFLVLGQFALHEVAELVRRARHRLRHQARKAGLGFRRLQGGNERLVELGNHVLRRAGGRHQPPPRVDG